MFSASPEIRGFLNKKHWSGATELARQLYGRMRKKEAQAGRDTVHILENGLPTAPGVDARDWICALALTPTNPAARLR